MVEIWAEKYRFWTLNVFQTSYKCSFIWREKYSDVTRLLSSHTQTKLFQICSILPFNFIYEAMMPLNIILTILTINLNQRCWLVEVTHKRGRWPTTNFETGLCNAAIFGKFLGKFVNENALKVNFLECLCVHLKGEGPRIPKRGLNFS